MKTILFSIPRRARAAGVPALCVVLLACADSGPAAPQGDETEIVPRMLFNGTDDFVHDATAAIMVYVDPNRTGVFEWRSFCTGALVHERVIQTAGHCIQFMQQQLAAGIMKAVWISFQHDPRANFNADPNLEDPADGGWYEVESLHNNPDNIDFLGLMQLPAEEVYAVWGKFHDTGAIVVKEPVKGIEPVEMASRPGSVERLLRSAQCEHPHRRNEFCKLLDVSYGLQEFPPTTNPAVQVRHSALLDYKGIDALFIATFDHPQGSDFGANCFGDSGSPVWLLKPSGKDRIVVAISSSPADPFNQPAPCATGALQYRTDTPSHQRFIRGVIDAVRNPSNSH